MSSPPYTVTKLVRWRVKDWVSCFVACKFPLEEERETNSPSSTTVVPREPAVLNPKVETNQKPQKEKESASSASSNKCLAKKREEIGESSSSKLPSFAEDDYIVFCFRDDGEVQVLHDKKSSEAAASARVGTSSSIPSSSKHVNLQQLIKLEDEPAKRDKVSNGEGNAKEPAQIKTGTLVDDETKEITDENGEEEETGQGKDASSDSNQSDAASTSSFAFPIIQEEWIGSPVQMPRPEGPKSKRINCCRF